MTIQLDPTTCKPGEAYMVRVDGRVFVGERVDPEDYLQWRLNRPASVWVRDVDVTVLHRLVPESDDVDTLRAALAVLERHGETSYNCGLLIDRLEAERKAAQEKSAADAKMDALIDESIDAYNRAAEAQASRAPLGSRDTAPWRDGIRAVIDVVLAEAVQP